MSEYKFMEEEIEYLTIRNKNLGQITVCLTSEYEKLKNDNNELKNALKERDCYNTTLKRKLKDFDKTEKHMDEICKNSNLKTNQINDLREVIKEKDEEIKKMQEKIDLFKSGIVAIQGELVLVNNWIKTTHELIRS